MSNARPERREGVLSEDEITRLMSRIDAAAEKAAERAARAAITTFESIGYDVTTPKSRSEINQDHVFVRDLRQGTGRAKIAAIGAFFLFVLSVIGHAFIEGAVGLLKTTVGK